MIHRFFLLSITLGFWAGIVFIQDLEGAELVGRVVDSQTGQGIPGALVRAIPQRSQAIEIKGRTDRDGKYHLVLLKGQYKLLFSVPDSNYLSRFYSASGQEQGDTLQIPSFDTFLAIDFTLLAGGSIAGTIQRRTDNRPMGNIHVYAETNGFRSSALSQRDGTYIFRALPPGNYKVQIVSLDENYLPVYFDNRLDAERADLIPIRNREEITGIDFALHQGGSIRGRVIARKTRLPMPGTKLVLDKLKSREPPRFTLTDQSGDYLFRGLRDGEYILESNPGSVDRSETVPESKYLVQFYNRRLERELAEKITIDRGSDAEDIDFELVEGGRINGVVWSHYHNAPLRNVEIFTRTNNDELLKLPKATTNKKGEYSLEGLPPGEYLLETHSLKPNQQHVNVFFRDKLARELADRLNLNEGEKLNLINFNLNLGGSVKGLVKIEDAEYRFDPSGVSVLMRTAGLDVFGFGERDYKLQADGSYLIDGAPAGRYTLTPKLKDPNLIADTEMVRRAVVLTEGEVEEGVDFNIKLGGSISGTIVSQSSFYTLDKLLIMLVNAKEQTKKTFEIGGEQYTLAGIPPGHYLMVLLSNAEKTHPNERLQPTRVFDSRYVDVIKGDTTKGVDFLVKPASSASPGTSLELN